mgnify:CR=1 FL=1
MNILSTCLSPPYHYALLNMYLIRSAEDTALRWVFPFALAVTAAACLSLVLVIHNAFAVSTSSVTAVVKSDRHRIRG